MGDSHKARSVPYNPQPSLWFWHLNDYPCSTLWWRKLKLREVVYLTEATQQATVARASPAPAPTQVPCHRSPPLRPSSSLLALVQHKRPGMVISRHGDDGLPLEGPRASLVHCVAGDGGCCVACPVQRVPATVIGQAFHRANICERQSRG